MLILYTDYTNHKTILYLSFSNLLKTKDYEFIVINFIKNHNHKKIVHTVHTVGMGHVARQPLWHIPSQGHGTWPTQALLASEEGPITVFSARQHHLDNGPRLQATPKWFARTPKRERNGRNWCYSLHLSTIFFLFSLLFLLAGPRPKIITTVKKKDRNPPIGPIWSPIVVITSAVLFCLAAYWIRLPGGRPSRGLRRCSTVHYVRRSAAISGRWANARRVQYTEERRPRRGKNEINFTLTGDDTVAALRSQ